MKMKLLGFFKSSFTRSVYRLLHSATFVMAYYRTHYWRLHLVCVVNHVKHRCVLEYYTSSQWHPS